MLLLDKLIASGHGTRVPYMLQNIEVGIELNTHLNPGESTFMVSILSNSDYLGYLVVSPWPRRVRVYPPASTYPMPTLLRLRLEEKDLTENELQVTFEMGLLYLLDCHRTAIRSQIQRLKDRLTHATVSQPL